MSKQYNYGEQEVVQAIAKALDAFYSSLIEKIDRIDVVKIMKRKNPYLYRAKGIATLLKYARPS